MWDVILLAPYVYHWLHPRLTHYRFYHWFDFPSFPTRRSISLLHYYCSECRCITQTAFSFPISCFIRYFIYISWLHYSLTNEWANCQAHKCFSWLNILTMITVRHPYISSTLRNLCGSLSCFILNLSNSNPWSWSLNTELSLVNRSFSGTRWNKSVLRNKGYIKKQRSHRLKKPTMFPLILRISNDFF